MYPSSPRQILNAAGVSAFLVSALTNIRYLAGVEMSVGFLLVTPQRFILFVDGRYTEAAREGVGRGVGVRDVGRMASALAKVRCCGCESEAVTLGQLRRWKRKFKNTKFVQKEGIVEGFRRTKGPEEIRKFRRAQRITQKLLRRIPQSLRQGITEKQLAWKLGEWAVCLGADSLSFDPIVAFGTHTSRPHHQPTDRVFRRGNIVQIDVGARYKGYCADQSMVFFTGRRTQKQERAFNAVSEAKVAAMKLVQAGASTHDLDGAAREVLRKYGCEKKFSHSLGHGVGLEIHEGVRISVRAPEEILRAGEIITIEPGVYFEGEFGIRLEEEVVVK
ncbi:MAG TPA: aminopeptidase P family protein [Candidatus Peribacteraceae bacterium]|nr:aminopeptidase P family protein [Candidatus Peribacteraceae bacterium]